jgi:FixJ family two-component response regulator
MEAPEWICSSITLEKDDLIIILDDDPSIHGAWDARFENVAPGLQYKHFEQGAEAINFINHLSDSEKKHIYLLTDYELMQGMNGLDVISQAGVKRSVLVTSHYNNEIVREKASKSNTKILPKPLAAEVEITVFSEKEQEKLKKVDLVIIDDDENLVSALKALLSDKKVDTYLTAKSFIDNMSDYAIDNTFLIDNRFKNEPITGIDLAKKLHNIGFSDLYLYSGWEFDDDDLVPKFLKMIEKTDIDAIKRLADKS